MGACQASSMGACQPDALRRVPDALRRRPGILYRSSATLIWMVLAFGQVERLGILLSLPLGRDHYMRLGILLLLTQQQQ